MATAFYTVRVENQYGDYMEFEHEYEIFDEDVEDFDPADRDVEREIYDDVMQNVYVNLDFDRLED